MKWIDIVSAAFNNLMRRKLRSALTMLGVVIGTAAIIVTISLGYGAEKTQMEALESYSNLRLIYVYPFWGGYGTTSNANQNRITKINDGVISRIRRIKGVDAVTPLVNVYFGGEPVIATGKYETYAQLVAVIPRDFARMYPLKTGNYFTGNTDRMEFIMSEMAMMEFRDPDKEYEWIDTWTILHEGGELPLPKINWLKANYNYSVRWDEPIDTSNPDNNTKRMNQDFKARMIGTMKADPDDWTFATSAVVSLNWVKRFQKENKSFIKERGGSPVENYDNVQVLAKSVEDVAQIVKDLNDIGLQYSSALDTVAQFRKQIQTMQGFLGFIGMISMMVAALSIANTMMMSIYERTREIGVMKVLGCKLGNIRMMFLSEAMFIGLFGGIAGLLLSYTLSYALNNVAWLKQMMASVMSTQQMGDGGTTSIIPMELALGTLLGVILVSVLSGVQPAQRAMKLSSLAAIRSAD